MATPPRNPSPHSASMDKNHLIQATPSNPWDVQVVSVAPPSIVRDVLSTKVKTVGAATDGWVALYDTRRIRVWSTTSLDRGSSSMLLEPPDKVHILYHPGLTKASSHPLLLKIASAASFSSNNTSLTTSPSHSTTHNGWVHCYAAHPDEGIVCFWRLLPEEVPQKLGRTVQCKVTLDLDEEEYLTSLDIVDKHHVVVGTSAKRLYFCTQTPHPMLLQAQELQVDDSSSNESGSLLGRLLWKTPAKKKPRRQAAASLEQDSIHSVHWLAPTTTTTTTTSSTDDEAMAFVSLTTSGQVHLWHGTCPTSLSNQSRAHFHATSLGLLLPEEEEVQVLQATVSNTTLHVICRTTPSSSQEARLDWIQASLQENALHLTHRHWLSRFSPSAHCAGLVDTCQGTYAVFSYPSIGEGPVTCVSLSGQVLGEVDFPVTHIPSVVFGTLGRDRVTHGCWGLATTGLGILLRQRFLSTTTTTDANDNNNNTTSALSHQLSRHLQSAFWHWYQHLNSSSSGSSSTAAPLPRLPPSLQQAPKEPLEIAILESAKHLQEQHSHATLANPLECHLAFVTLLRQGGLYRSLSLTAQWTLLGIGQELAVYQTLVHEQEQQPFHVRVRLLPHAVTDYLCQTYKPSSPDRLLAALRTATLFRQERVAHTYDIPQESPPPPSSSSSQRLLWTTSQALQGLMRQVLTEESSHRQMSPVHLETLVSVALESHQESSSPGQEQDLYDQVKALGIPLIRLIPDDDLAWSLSVQHEWYEGVCQLARDHDKEPAFSLEPLFETFSQDTFGSFVLDWHLDRRDYAHVLNYGQWCPAILQDLCNSDPRLGPYRWIAAVRLQQWDRAGEWLCDIPDSTLSQTKRNASLAKLSLTPAMAKRRKLVDARLELVQAQEMLRVDDDDDDSPLWSPHDLLSLAVDKLEASCATKDREDAIQYAVIGLAVAKSMERGDDRLKGAALVWKSCIATDLRQWLEWVRTQNDLMDRSLIAFILESTIFGGVWMEVSREDRNEVSYGTKVEHLVVDHLGLDAMESVELRRLLNIVTS